MRWLAALAVVLSACTSTPGPDDELGGESSSDAASTTEAASESLSDTTSSGSETSGSGTSETASETSGGETSGTSETGEPTLGRVLFVGNSYTFSNDLPGVFEALTASVAMPQEVDSLAVAGATVANHVANPQLQPLLEQGWDVVVIQAQSYEAIVDEPGFQAAMLDFAALVDAASPGARLVVFETWARAPGNETLVELGMTAEQMQAALSEAYAEAALLVGGELAPVGQAWALSLVEAPAITLHFSDGSHPSVAGTYLAAAVFHAHVLGQPASEATYVPPGLVPADAALLAGFADQVVMP